MRRNNLNTLIGYKGKPCSRTLKSEYLKFCRIFLLKKNISKKRAYCICK